MAAAMALGAAGVWTGSLWLTVQEAEAEPAEVQCYLDATSEDTVRSRSFTGKPCRMLKNDWTEAWAAEDTPDPLGMPLQGLVTGDAIRRTNRYASVEGAQQVAFNAVGQVVGLMKNVEKTRDVMNRLLVEYTDAVERLQSLMPE
jgi:NAD(P)H-dependent flavin oxidoreductase YrpB (nitropropane dioxygenase family)